MTIDGTRFATQRIRNPEKWLAQVEMRGDGGEEPEALDGDTQLAEIMLMGLRLAEGVSEARLHAACGHNFDTAFEGNRLEALIKNDLVVRTGDSIRTTATGRLRLDSVIAHLLN
jgi:oxygen-independent coproporphyrinogen-3 oxidase